MNKKFNTLFVTMLGIGNIKIIPGTFGSLSTIIIIYIFFHILNVSPNIILVGLVLIFFLINSLINDFITQNNCLKP